MPPLTTRELNSSEISELLSRNFEIRLRVLEFEALASLPNIFVADAGQIDNESAYFKIPGLIPPDGIRFQDEKWGTVVIAPDAARTLRYSIVLTGQLGDGVSNRITPSIPDPPELPSITTIFIVLAVVLGLVIVADRKL